jgi:hypothetical protein
MIGMVRVASFPFRVALTDDQFRQDSSLCVVGIRCPQSAGFANPAGSKQQCRIRRDRVEVLKS